MKSLLVFTSRCLRESFSCAEMLVRPKRRLPSKDPKYLFQIVVGFLQKSEPISTCLQTRGEPPSLLLLQLELGLEFYELLLERQVVVEHLALFHRCDFICAFRSLPFGRRAKTVLTCRSVRFKGGGSGWRRSSPCLCVQFLRVRGELRADSRGSTYRFRALVAASSG